jgi:acetyltransferase-like isoleucine patch superfamily enzyme
MKDSGANNTNMSEVRKSRAFRIAEARKAFRAFVKSDRLKMMIDINGLSHEDVENIVYGGTFDKLRMFVRYVASSSLYPLPFSRFKCFVYRLLGIKIGKNVYISPGVFIDMIAPRLVSIGDNVMIGMGVKIAAHERTMQTLSLGRVHIGNGVTIGGLSIIRHATRIGDDAQIDIMCNISRNVPGGSRVASQRNGVTHHG